MQRRLANLLHFRHRAPSKKSLPLRRHQTLAFSLPYHVFLRDATLESYNKDPSLSVDQKKKNFKVMCVL